MTTIPFRRPDPSEDPRPVYLTREEAARIARCSYRTIQRAQASGRLRRLGVGLRALVSESELRAWVEAGMPAREPRPRQSRAPRRGGPGSVASIREMDPSLGSRRAR